MEGRSRVQFGYQVDMILFRTVKLFSHPTYSNRALLTKERPELAAVRTHIMTRTVEQLQLKAPVLNRRA